MSDFNPQQFRDDLTEDIHRRVRQRQMFYRRHRRHSGAFGIVVGTTILLVGVLFLLENFGLIHVQRAWQYWPAILIALLRNVSGAPTPLFNPLPGCGSFG